MFLGVAFFSWQLSWQGFFFFGGGALARFFCFLECVLARAFFFLGVCLIGSLCLWRVAFFLVLPKAFWVIENV